MPPVTRQASPGTVNAWWRHPNQAHTADLNASVSLENDLGGTGYFTMGQNADISNAPEHEVTLSNGFYLGKYEVTQAQYEADHGEYGNR